MKYKAADLKSYYGELKSTHMVWRPIWQTIEDLCFPAPGNFMQLTMSRSTEGGEVIDRMTDLGIKCTERAASGIFSHLLSGRFFKLKDRKGRYEKQFASLTDRALEVLVEGNFYEEAFNFLKKFFALGTSVDYTEYDDESARLVTKVLSLKKVYLDVDWRGVVSTYMREEVMTAADAVRYFGEDKVHHSVRKDARKPSTRRNKVTYLQVVMPNDDYDSSNPLSYAFTSHWLDLSNDKIVKESGFYSCPFAVGRSSAVDDEAYGYGAGHQSLNSLLRVVHLNEMLASISDRMGDPPWLDDIVSEASAISNDGSQIITWDSTKGGRPPERLREEGNPEMWLKEREEFTKETKEAFFLDFLQLLSQIPESGRTKYEIFQRMREKMDMLVAPLRKLRSEWLEARISRVVEILLRKKLVDALPEDVEGYDIVLTGRLAQFLEEVESGNVEDALMTLLELSKADPEVMDWIDMDVAAKSVLDRIPLPAGVIRDETAVKERRKERKEAAEKMQQQQAQAMQAQTLMQMYQQGSKAPESGSLAEQMNSPEAQEALNAIAG